MQFIVEESNRLDKFLAAALPNFSRSRLVKIIDAGGVNVDGTPQRSSFSVVPGMVVSLDEVEPIAAHDLTPAAIPLDIRFEDADLLIVNKPRGLAAHPAASLREPSLVNALLHHGRELSGVAGDYRPGIVHRLDKDTTGLMVVAKNDAAHVNLAKQIEDKTAERRYFAVTAGRHDQRQFVIDAPIGRDKHNRQRMAVDMGGKRAVTFVREVTRLDQGTLYALRLGTGRTHQIRVHLQTLGLPVLGDKLYAPKEFQDVPLQLHAAYLQVDHPVTGDRMSFFAPPPDDFLGREFALEPAILAFDEPLPSNP